MVDKVMKNRKMKFSALLCICLVLTGCSLFLKNDNNSLKQNLQAEDRKEEVRQQFDDYLDSLFCEEVTASTINLHYTLTNPENYGIKEYPITYGTISTQAIDEGVAILENIKATLSSYDKKLLRKEQQMTYDILMDYAKNELGNTDLYLYHEILRASTGTQAELPVLMAEYTFYREQDIKDYLGLLLELPDYFRQIIAFEKDKANVGLFMPDFAADDVITQCENFIKEPENNYLLDTFNDKVDAMPEISEEQKTAYKEENEVAVLECVVPAYSILIQEITALKGSGTNELGLCYYKDGKEYYEYLVKYYTGSNLSIEKMQKQTEDKRMRDIKEVARLVEEDPDLLTQTTSYAFAQAEPAAIIKDLQNKMQADFKALPDTDVIIKYVHDSLEEYMAPAFYLTAPIDDSSPKAIYINRSSNYEKIKLYTTLAHEGFPGHLYQNVMEHNVMEHNILKVRSLINCIGYSEGWATYVEMLSYYYADIDPRLAAVLQQDQSAMLSLYATADMGIHYDGWTLEETKDFFAQYRITNEEAITDIFHLIVEEPGHYLKYYIGYLEFLNLNDYAKKTYGEKYSDYQFHETIMNMGSAPFYILKEYLPDYYGK
ncbi:DUF885 domain-containing protein [Lachnospiraceae bacterium ZAX-1]